MLRLHAKKLQLCLGCSFRSLKAEGFFDVSSCHAGPLEVTVLVRNEVRCTTLVFVRVWEGGRKREGAYNILVRNEVWRTRDRRGNLRPISLPYIQPVICHAYCVILVLSPKPVFLSSHLVHLPLDFAPGPPSDM